MDVIRHISTSPRRFVAPVVTLGNFDGVHRGHQAILARVVDEATRRASEAVVMTFTPHPLAVLRPERAPDALTDLHDKVALLAAAGVHVLVLQHFTRAFAQLTAETFVDRFIVGRFGAGKLIVGHSVSFGHERRGNAALLETLGAQRGFAVEVIGPVTEDGHEVSSSAIRQAIAAGELALATRLLGRPHRLSGRVVHGKHRGAGLGFPTANVRVTEGLHPPDGVYAVVAQTPQGRLPGVANIGTNPTFGPNARSLEVHCFDFTGDLYGARLGVDFIARLREEIAFRSVESLVEQMHRDAEQARSILARRP